MEKMKKQRFADALSLAIKKKNLKRKRRDEYDAGSEILKDVLH